METLLLFDFFIPELLSLLLLAIPIILILVVVFRRVIANRERRYELEEEVYRDSGIDER